MRILENTNFNFIGKRKIFYIVASVIFLTCLVSIIVNGGPDYHIDFTGGLSIELAPQPANGVFLDVHQIREALLRHQFTGAEIQELPQTNSFLIKTKLDEQGGDVLLEILREEFPEHMNISDPDLIRSREEVGPRAGADLRKKAINAVLLSLLLILFYIWVRFRFAWGFVAAFALCFDTIVTLGVLTIMGIEVGMTVMAGLLTIVGYSINNTIVIFDRIRENLKLYRKEDDSVVTNRSINETLSRTVILTFTTLLTCLSLIIFGGSVIFNFAFTFTVGIVVGTFSSMCLAPTLVLDTVIAIKNRKTVKKGRK